MPALSLLTLPCLWLYAAYLAVSAACQLCHATSFICLASRTLALCLLLFPRFFAHRHASGVLMELWLHSVLCLDAATHPPYLTFNLLLFFRFSLHRYAPGDPVESWLHSVLCLDAATHLPRPPGKLPHPSSCELFYVERDTLFSFHKASEAFLQRVCLLSCLLQTPLQACSV
jgi:hypothetical protein